MQRQVALPEPSAVPSTSPPPPLIQRVVTIQGAVSIQRSTVPAADSNETQFQQEGKPRVYKLVHVNLDRDLVLGQRRVQHRNNEMIQELM